ncbi:MAG: rhs family protein [Parachlamydiales bacterium]|nr:rhs family protein [Parachlamydiales bacterium]
MRFRREFSSSHAEIGAAISIELNGQVFAPIHDLQGNAESLISLDTKQPVAAYHYSAFGEEQIGGVISPWRFASKRTDAGLVFFGRRYYSPSLGRWLTPDPLGYTDEINRYSYVRNNPLNRFDEC